MPENYEGIDISHNNNVTSFREVSSAKSWLYIKATEGSTFKDPMLNEYSARAAGLNFRKIGLYHFWAPLSDGVSQAQNYLSSVVELEANEFPVLDIEESLVDPNDPSTSRWNDVDPAVAVARINSFVYTIKKALKIKSEDVYIYGSVGWLNGYFGSHLKDLTYMKLIAARYNSVLGSVEPWDHAEAWQYDEHGSCPGVEGEVDLDRWINPLTW